MQVDLGAVSLTRRQTYGQADVKTGRCSGGQTYGQANFHLQVDAQAALQAGKLWAGERSDRQMFRQAEVKADNGWADITIRRQKYKHADMQTYRPATCRQANMQTGKHSGRQT